MAISIIHIGLPLESIPEEERPKIAKRLSDLRDRMTRDGYRYEIVHASPETGLAAFIHRLKTQPCDGVLIGGAVAGDPTLSHFMEQIINVTHEAAPKAKVMFYNHSVDVRTIVERWFPSPWNIRPATIHDAQSIAEVHVESYKTAYRGIFPDAFLNGLSVGQRETAWRNILASQDPSSSITILACEANGNVVGFASGGKERSAKLGCDGELYAIYLHPEKQRKGLGAVLIRQLAPELATRGFASMAVWVLERNPARRFYERFGGKIIGQQQIERGGQTFIEVAYGWPSLDAFR